MLNSPWITGACLLVCAANLFAAIAWLVHGEILQGIRDLSTAILFGSLAVLLPLDRGG